MLMMMMRTVPWDGARWTSGRLRLPCLAAFDGSHMGGHGYLRGGQVLLDLSAPT